jgi:Na+/proline symporter
MWNIVPLIGIAFWLGLWWRRANRYGAWASFIAATLTWMYGYWGLKWTNDATLPYLITLYLGSGVLAGVVVSLCTPREPEWRLDRFYATIWTPVDREQELEAVLERLPQTKEMARA